MNQTIEASVLLTQGIIFKHKFAKPRWSIFSTIVDGIALSREFVRKFVTKPIGVHLMSINPLPEPKSSHPGLP
jgi:hypothetical protein